jgi:hypothetical protein
MSALLIEFERGPMALVFSMERRSATVNIANAMNSSRLVIGGLAVLAVSALVWFTVSREPTTKVPVQSSTPPLPANPPASEPQRAEPMSDAVRSVAVEERALEVATPAPATAQVTNFDRRQEIERAGYEAAGMSADVAFAQLAATDRFKGTLGIFAWMFTRPCRRGSRRLFCGGETSRQPEGTQGGARIFGRGLRGGAGGEGTSLAVTRKDEEMEVAGLFADRSDMRSLLSSLMAQPDVAAEGARELLEGRELAHFLGEIAARVAADDPQRAMSYGAGLEGKERADFLIQLAGGWAAAHGDAAWDWSQAEPDPTLRAAMQAAVLENWAEKIPRPWRALCRQVTEKKRANRFSQKSVSNGAKRIRARRWRGRKAFQMSRSASVRWRRFVKRRQWGSARFSQRDAEGYPVIREVVPGGAVSKSPGLAAGSQIAAVRDASGQFIDAKDGTSVTSFRCSAARRARWWRCR